VAALVAEAPPLLLNVLLVEDESVVAEDVQDALEELGCRVIGWATTAADAERLAADHAPDVILMDVRLKGGVDGIEAAAHLRKGHDAPIIFASECWTRRCANAFAWCHSLPFCRSHIP
jgi:CheY-like chemotaxis protein